MKLSKAIIKKYGITKKAWAVARGSKSSTRHRTSARGSTMAKKKKGSHKKSSGGSNSWVSLIAAAAYGAFRPQITQAIAPAVNYLPFGAYNNNVALGGLATVVPMVAKNKMVADALKPVQYMEVALAANTAASGIMGSSASSTSGVTFVN